MKYVLNYAQEQAVKHEKGPALVIAGPGSGKTTVIAARTVLLERNVCSPEKIRTVCFGRAAQEEMRKRYELYRESRARGAEFCTIHSICLKILREKNKKIIIADETEKAGTVEMIYRKINGSGETDIRQLVNAISRQRNLAGYGKTIPPQIFGFAEICGEYEKYKKENNVADYDDMIFYAREILGNDDKIRKKYAALFLQCDEAQDLSKAQFDVISLLCPEKNIFAVADDDQSIYGFRGADPGCIMNFEKYYEGCTLYRLEENYRSTGKIVEFAGRISSENRERMEKHIFTKNEPGAETEILDFEDGIRQSEFIYKRIGKILRKSSEDVGILYRNNISPLILMLMMTDGKTDFRILGTGCDPGSLFGVKTFLRYLKSETETGNGIFVPSPEGVLQKAMNRGLIQRILRECEKTGRQKRTAYEIGEFLTVLCEYGKTGEEIENILAKLTKTINEGGRNPDKSRVTLSTVHSSKGLEFENVIIMDMVNGEFPGTGAITGKLLEEERRLYYVAATRAAKTLTVTYPRKRGEMFETKSVLLRE